MDLAQWINPKYLSEQWLSQAQKQYVSAQPFAHIQVADFLLEKRLEQLESALQLQEFHHKESDLFGLAQTPDLTQTEDPIISSYIKMLNSDEFRSWVQRITRIWTKPGELDLFGAIYQDCDYLLPHDDQLDDRKIAFILYFTTLHEEEGGALALYTHEHGHPGKVVARYAPVRGALNMFTVDEKSWHEVEEITGEVLRVSIGGWLRG